MKQTLLDEYVELCIGARETVPVFDRMIQVIQETRPVAHIWRDGDLDAPLPAQVIDWPDPAMLVYTPGGIVPGRHRFAVDVDSTYDAPEFNTWFNRNYYLAGVFVFTRPGFDRFDAIPLVKQNTGQLIMADAQLSYELTPEGWAWQYAVVGPNNWFFHSWFRNELDEDSKAQMDDNVNLLGNTVTRYLSAYLDHLKKDGEWFVKEPKASKVKLNKEGKVRKVIKPATLGYKEWKLNVTS